MSNNRNFKPQLEQTVMCWHGDNCSRYDPQTGVRRGCWFAHAENELRCKEYAMFNKCSLGEHCPKKHTKSPSHRIKMSYTHTEGERPDMVVLDFKRPLPPHNLPPFLQGLVAQSKEQAVKLTGFGAASAESHLTNHYAYAPSLFGDNSEKLERFKAIYANLTNAKAFNERALELEMWQQLSDVRRYDLSDAVIKESTFVSGKTLHRIDCDGLAEKRPSVLRGDRLYATDNNTNMRHCGYVHFVNLDHVWVCFDQRQFRPSRTTTFAVEFTIQRTTFRRQFDCLEHCTTLFTTDEELTPSPFANWTPDSCAKIREEMPFASSLNVSQCACVAKVVGHKPLSGTLGLTLIHGPPGTGKTTTVVAAINELHRLGKRVLVCCPSNHAADLIVERVTAKNSDASIVRIYGLSTLPADNIKQYSVKPTEYTEAAASKKIVVTTVMSAGLLFHLGVDANPFDHIVVDEAGQATEAEMAVPLAFADKSHGTHVTLAGDHKQLGPVLRSRAAERFDFGRSMLGRLMDTSAYKPHGILLVENYRSHPAILELYNRITYDNKLIACASKSHISVVSDNVDGIFPCKEAPVVFRHVRGVEARERDSPSWMNMMEVDEVMKILMSIFSKRTSAMKFADVVVLAPYQKQCKKIQAKLHYYFQTGTFPFKVSDYDRNKPPIKVCSVEQFQGRESTLVILSCVRSAKSEELGSDLIQSIGFLKQPKRFNVAISRAVAGLIVVGNAGMLQVDDGWKKLINLLSGCDMDGNEEAGRPSLVVDTTRDCSLSAAEVKALAPTKSRSDIATAGQTSFVSLHADPLSMVAAPTSFATDTEWGRVE